MTGARKDVIAHGAEFQSRRLFPPDVIREGEMVPPDGRGSRPPGRSGKPARALGLSRAGQAVEYSCRGDRARIGPHGVRPDHVSFRFVANRTIPYMELH